MGNIVAIVGRPNVGKSTLFNRLIGERSAIVDDISGVTRDRNYGMCTWNGKPFTVIDTGGFVHGSDDVFEAAIRSQVNVAIEEASAIIFMTDTSTGITDLDEEVAKMLRKTEKPVFLAVNKVDNYNRQLAANEFWSLGFEQTFFLSSMTGSGTGELLDAVTEMLSEEPEELPDIPKMAILGQPNVGKSSLINTLLGEERNIVTDVAGTTRDTVHSRFTKFGMDMLLIDTAGLRKKAKVHEELEFYSVMRAIKALDECDICILMVNADDGLESQDLSILNLALKRNKGIVMAVNKWDLIEKETNTARDFEQAIRKRTAPFSDYPIVFTSVLEKQRVLQVLEKAMLVYNNRSKRVKTHELNDYMMEIIDRTPPPSHKGKYVKIKYITQLPTASPAFAFFCNHPKYIKDSYRQFLENKIRERWDFSGVPVRVFFRQK